MEVLANYDFTALQDLVEDLIDHSDGEFFASAVTKKVAPDYFEFVKRPMDLNKINNNLRQMKYMSNQEVIADIEQMFENCFLYNETETEVYKAGIRLKKYFEKVAIEFGLMAPEKTKTPMDEGLNMTFEISQPEINHSPPLEIEENRHENDLPSNFEQVSGEDIDARAEKSHPQASMNENFPILKKPLLVLKDVTKNSLYSTNGTSATTLGKSIYQIKFKILPTKQAKIIFYDRLLVCIKTSK